MYPNNYYICEEKISENTFIMIENPLNRAFSSEV